MAVPALQKLQGPRIKTRDSVTSDRCATILPTSYSYSTLLIKATPTPIAILTPQLMVLYLIRLEYFSTNGSIPVRRPQPRSTITR